MMVFLEKLADQGGIPGLIAVIAIIISVVIQNRVRDRHEKQLISINNSHNKELTSQADKFTVVVSSLQIGWQSKIDAMFATMHDKLGEIEKAHHEQEDELTDRLVKSSSNYGETTGRLVEKLGALADSMRKKGDSSGTPT